MIITSILNIVYIIIFALTYPFRYLTDVSAENWFNSTITSANGYIGMFYGWLPVFLTTLMLTWGLYLAIEVLIFSYKGIMWVIKKIPGIS